MANCKDCGKPLDFDRMLCRFCGGWTAVDKEVGLLGAVSEKSTVMLDQVDATAVERIVTGGVWDAAFGGGIVPTGSTLFGGQPGAGKALALDTPIPTPTGWTTMGEIKTGDELFDENGDVCSVLMHTRVMRGHTCYELTFSDGEKIVADADHLWLTTTCRERDVALFQSEEWKARRRANRPSRGKGLRKRTCVGYNPNLARSQKRLHNVGGAVRTTLQIADSLYYGKHVNHAVTASKPLVLPQVELPIPPYTLGVWLGDGNASDGRYCGLDSKIAERVRAEGFQVSKKKYGNATPMWTVYGLRPRLRKLGLLKNKHIPSIYLRASVEQRLCLLQGLMDTDGDCAKNGQCYFNTSSTALRDGFQELAVSLGVRAVPNERETKLYGRVTGRAWRFGFTTVLPVFSLRRKGKRQRMPSRGVHNQRYIVSARRVRSVPVKCIAVDSPSKLYLAGRHMTPTHNTTLLLQVASLVAGITGKTAYYFSAEQAPGELKMTVDRLALEYVKRIRVIREMGGGAEIEAALLKKDPPCLFVIDSITALCGQDKIAALEVVKRFKSLSAKWGAASILIGQMSKDNDYMGLNAVQHQVDTLMTIGCPDNDADVIKVLSATYPKLERKHLRKLMNDGRLDEITRDMRITTTWKNRFGPSHVETALMMTPHGLLPLPSMEEIMGTGAHSFDKPRAARVEGGEKPRPSRPSTVIPPPSSEANVIGDSLHPPKVDEIVVNGQKLKRVKPKKKKGLFFEGADGGEVPPPMPAAAMPAIAGEALKQKRAALPRTAEGKKAAAARRKKEARA